MRYSICPNCGEITPYPDTALKGTRTCQKCKVKAFQPLTDTREIAEQLVGAIKMYREMCK